jgi:hypothetical protein
VVNFNRLTFPLGLTNTPNQLSVSVYASRVLFAIVCYYPQFSVALSTLVQYAFFHAGLTHVQAELRNILDDSVEEAGAVNIRCPLFLLPLIPHVPLHYRRPLYPHGPCPRGPHHLLLRTERTHNMGCTSG